MVIAVADMGTFFSPSSALLDNHFDELLETIEEIRGLTALLKSLPPANEKREEYERRLYANASSMKLAASWPSTTASPTKNWTSSSTTTSTTVWDRMQRK
jgi:hypothetical protein